MYRSALDVVTKPTQSISPKIWATASPTRKSRIILLAVGVALYIAFWQISSWRDTTSTTGTEGSPSPRSEQELLHALEVCQKQSHGLSEAGTQTGADHGQDRQSSYVASFGEDAGRDIAIVEQTNCSLLDDASEYMPDFIHIPFEAAVAEDSLAGWEDEWISRGTYNVRSWGTLEEPKIDFVYLCKSEVSHGEYSTH